VGHDSHFAQKFRSAKPPGCSTLGVSCPRSIAAASQCFNPEINDSKHNHRRRRPDSDLVLLATPVGAIDSVLEQIAPVLGANTIVTDAGSVKQSVIDSARLRLRHFENFVPAHPIAGTEHSGVEAGFASLYQGRRLILTPVAETSPSASEHHAGGGFADYTRIASSDPVMWRDVCLYNREAILASLGQFKHGLDALVDAIEAKDGETLEQLFTTAKQTRDTKVLRSSGLENKPE